jgi:hypothetical protein
MGVNHDLWSYCLTCQNHIKKGVNMLNDIKIVFYEDDKFKHQTGELKLVNANFTQLELIVNSIRESQNESGYPCHFKIIAQSLDY